MGKFWGAFLGLLWLGVGSLSAFERGSHWVYLGGTPASAYAPNFLAPPVEAGLILGDSFTLGADASRSHFDLGHNEEDERYYRGMMSNGNMIGERWEILEYRLDLPTDAKANGVHQSSGAVARWFLTDTFNLRFAVHQKSTEGQVELPVGQTGLTAKGDYLATTQIQSLGIGTQWQTQIGLIIGRIGNRFYYPRPGPNCYPISRGPHSGPGLRSKYQ